MTMAFSYGFFNAKNLDRVYTAEDFTGYLSSLICDGILDTYGNNFSLNSNGLKLTLSTGKAWIHGHYFVNDAPYTLDFSQYVDESLARYVLICITCDTAENVRSVSLEIVKGTASATPTQPSPTKSDSRKSLILYAVRLSAGITEIQSSNIIDYRDDTNKCGYCKCILGKCKVTEMLAEMAKTNAALDELQKRLDAMNSQLSDLQTKVDDLTDGEIVSAGKCGENIYYVMYKNGKLLLRGTGATYDYALGNDSEKSIFDGDETIKSIVLGEGITKVGDYLFHGCKNAVSVSMPTTLKSIGTGSFSPSITASGVTGELTAINIPNNVTVIGSSAFSNNAIQELLIPSSVTELGSYVFSNCAKLKSVRSESTTIGAFAFTKCTALSNLTIAASCKTFGSNILTYCEKLTAITCEGSKAQWNSITKPDNWISSGDHNHNGYLQRIDCVDGSFVWDTERNTWNEVDN